MTPTDERLARILLEARTIAMLGASIRPERPSHRVGNYLVAAGYRVIPVNPTHAGAELFGEKVRASLRDVGEHVDLLDIFRRPEFVPRAVRDALRHLAGLRAVWMQLGITSAEARALAEARGLDVVENRCMLIEHRRLIARSESRV